MERKDTEIEKRIARAKYNFAIDSDHREVLRRRALAEYDKSRSAGWQTAWNWSIKSAWRWIMARPIYRLGIPTALTVVVIMSIFALLPARPGLALEQVIAPLLSAQSGRCQVVVQMRDGKLPPVKFDAMFRGNVNRQESKDLGTVMVMDSAQGLVMSLSPQQKQAHILQQINRDPQQAMESGFLQQIREQLLGLSNDPKITQRLSLGEREIADKKLIGYRIIGAGGQTDIWGDEETGLPHSIVSNMDAFPNMKVTMTDFEFDIELEDALFSLTPPAGYTVIRNTMDMSLMSEQGFIAALRKSAEINDGVYPDTINAMVGIQLAADYATQLTSASESEREKEVSRVRNLFAAGFAFPLQLTADNEAAYAGKGVHQTDAKRPIFWYRPDEANEYRVVFADLTVVDAAEPPQGTGAQRFGGGSRETSAD